MAPNPNGWMGIPGSGLTSGPEQLYFRRSMKVLGNSWNLSLDDLIASFSNGDNASRDRRVPPGFGWN